jgi:hypothetical protein
MFKYLKAFFAGDVRLQLFNAFAFEFHDLPTSETNQMIMVLALGLVLKAGGTIAKLA